MTTDSAPMETSSAEDASAKETLGGACSSDDGCAEGLVCSKKGVADKWPAHGVCTAKCTTVADCAGFKVGAACAPFGSAQKWCLEPCTEGPSGLDSLKAGPLRGKCHGRADVACQKLLDGSLACRPSCNDDSACDGAYCSPSGGTCTKDPATGWEDIGKTGTCGTDYVTGTPPYQYCTASCVLGVVPSCKWSGRGTKASSACLRAGPTAGQGDHGLCARVCDSDCDCDSPLQCEPFSVEAFKTETGRKGVCAATPSTNIQCADGADGDGG